MIARFQTLTALEATAARDAVAGLEQILWGYQQGCGRGQVAEVREWFEDPRQRRALERAADKLYRDPDPR